MTQHIYKLHFFEPNKGKRDHYFTSLAAIYTVFLPEDIGCKVSNLWNLKVAEGVPYENDKCRITKEVLTKKRQENGK